MYRILSSLRQGSRQLAKLCHAGCYGLLLAPSRLLAACAISVGRTSNPEASRYPKSRNAAGVTICVVPMDRTGSKCSLSPVTR